MIIFNHSFDCMDMLSPLDGSWDFYPFDSYQPDEMCFFDIETTGLSPQTSNVYLIGAGFYEGSEFKVVQWFADDYNSEKKIIKEFLKFIGSYKVLFQYNGNTFDIPYIRWKCARHKLDCSVFDELVNVDLFAKLRKFGDMLGLENKKLISFEHFIGLNRDDTFNGGELIEVYAQFMQDRFLKKDSELLLHLLLLHNYEDITGLSQVAVLLVLREFNKLPVSYKSVDVSQGFLTVTYECKVPYDFSFQVESFKKKTNVDVMSPVECRISDGKITLFIPISKKTLKYYFNDYREYYYMIEEETVMHKSVALYADSSVRRKAKKQECFVTHEGRFIPVKKSGCFSKDYHLFKEDYTSKEYYIDVDDAVAHAGDFFTTYFSQIF